MPSTKAATLVISPTIIKINIDQINVSLDKSPPPLHRSKCRSVLDPDGLSNHKKRYKHIQYSRKVTIRF